MILKLFPLFVAIFSFLAAKKKRISTDIGARDKPLIEK